MRRIALVFILATALILPACTSVPGKRAVKRAVFDLGGHVASVYD